VHKARLVMDLPPLLKEALALAAPVPR